MSREQEPVIRTMELGSYYLAEVYCRVAGVVPGMSIEILPADTEEERMGALSVYADVLEYDQGAYGVDIDLAAETKQADLHLKAGGIIVMMAFETEYHMGEFITQVDAYKERLAQLN